MIYGRYYITYVFRMANVNGDSLLVSSSIAYVVNMLMTIPALIWIDRVGRRPALLGGSILMAAWLFAISATLAVHGRDPGPNGVDGIREASILVTGGAAKAVIACSILFVASFSPTWGPVSWIYPPELYPTHLRAKAVALTTSANWLFNFALALFVVSIPKNHGKTGEFSLTQSCSPSPSCTSNGRHISFLRPSAWS